MSFGTYLLRRLLHIVPALVGLSILIFVLSRVIPGDPARLALGPDATEEQVRQLREEMGLDQPLLTQYVRYVAGLFRGDFGFSLRTRRNVAQDIREFLPATVELTTVAMLFAVAVGLPLGVLAAVHKDRPADHISRLLALAGVALPRFWLAILLQLLFAYYLGILPTIGRGPVPPVRITGLFLLDSLLTLNIPAFLVALKHIALPAVALSLGSLAQITRLVRANMIEEMRRDYALAARSYGLPERVIIFKYVLKNAFSSALTVIGLSYGFLLGNAFLVETVFAWPGLAFYGVDSLLFKDLNAVVGVTIVIGVAFAVVNLLVDIAYGYLDPRIRYEA
ncbi:MAG: ABC transporter permease [Armatimonadota bacterium]|nr:ABC transporter permease [Armatimonadota bacterium]MDR7452458.1 ABC transporter permease [Armatimonadota bacterium]MDR7466196.1 ABC transporter permease [Armatimonadota bacterium]MDR7495121.1 ABC transporter permease [Armatimonadota bacterium]MDR7500540.1 ABC transporter permease [Armatimonadota bacterium]